MPVKRCFDVSLSIDENMVFQQNINLYPWAPPSQLDGNLISSDLNGVSTAPFDGPQCIHIHVVINQPEHIVQFMSGRVGPHGTVTARGAEISDDIRS
jgi:hypothetical protein